MPSLHECHGQEAYIFETSAMHVACARASGLGRAGRPRAAGYFVYILYICIYLFISVLSLCSGIHGVSIMLHMDLSLIMAFKRALFAGKQEKIWLSRLFCETPDDILGLASLKKFSPRCFVVQPQLGFFTVRACRVRASRCIMEHPTTGDAPQSNEGLSRDLH